MNLSSTFGIGEATSEYWFKKLKLVGHKFCSAAAEKKLEYALCGDWCKSTPPPTRKAELLWMTSHYGPTVVQSVTETGNDKCSSSRVRWQSENTQALYPWHLLKPSFNRLLRATFVPSFKSLRWGVSFYRTLVVQYRHTHIVTKWSQYPRRRRSTTARIKIGLWVKHRRRHRGACCLCWVVHFF